MKLVYYDKDGVRQPGIVDKAGLHIIPISSVLGGRAFPDMISLIQSVSAEDISRLAAVAGQNWAEDEGDGDYLRLPFSEVKVLAPIERPIHDIICVGVNYRDHLEETKESAGGFDEAPKKPVYFGKRAIRILGPDEEIEARMDLDEHLDYEVELAVIIGKRGVNIPRENAEEYIFGYSVFNDISARALQMDHVQWYRGKSLDTYSAMGPVILHKSGLPFPVELEVTSLINGEVRQQSNSRLLLTDIPSLIADLSKGMTLEPGDIIATGTPAGVGMGLKPPCYMKSGDEVVCQISEIGRLRNTVK